LREPLRHSILASSSFVGEVTADCSAIQGPGLLPPAAQAAVRLVLAQPSITSPLVDNLNASIHVRAMLTDLFLVDEVLKARRTATTDPDAPG